MEKFKETVENGPKMEDLEQANEPGDLAQSRGDDGCPDDPEVQECNDFEPDSPTEGDQRGHGGRAGFVINPPLAAATQDVCELVRNDPFLTRLPDNAYKMRFPVMCRICVRKATKKPAVFDLVNLRRTKYFYQHVQGPTHVDNVAAHIRKTKSKEAALDAAGQETAADFEGFDPPKCDGFVVERAVNTKVHGVLAEFRLWFVYHCTNHIVKLQTEEDSRHQYSYDRRKQEHIIFHRLCTKEAVPNDLQLSMCTKCRSLGNDRPLLRCIGKFYVKYCAGRALDE